MTSSATHPRPLTRSSIESAYELIKPHIHLTPVLTNSTLNALASTPQPVTALKGTPYESHTPAKPHINFFFKCENFQKGGAFKARGAFHSLSRLLQDASSSTAHAVRTAGVITHSSGNHAQALALAARTFDVKATIVMPTISTPAKIAATKGYGARVVFSGSTAVERESVVRRLMDEEPGLVLVPPYDAVDIVLGQGTQALELEAQVRELVAAEPGLSVHGSRNSRRLDAVIAPCGGGGMLSGIATALAGTGTRVFGAEPSFQGADDCRRGLAAGKRIESVSSLTVADGVRTPVGVIPWSVISDPHKVAGVFAVSEEQILQAMRLVWERMKVVIEPTAALGLAVALFDKEFRALVEREGGEEGWDVGVVFSGGNVAMEAVGDLLARGASAWEVERAEGIVGAKGERVAENVAG